MERPQSSPRARMDLTTVPNPTPSSRAIFGKLRPCFRSSRALPRSNIRFGRPSRLPWRLALATPDATRSRINSRSNSATAARMCSMSLAVGLFSSVSIFCVTARKRTPSDTSSWIDRTQSATLRSQRSSLASSLGNLLRQTSPKRSHIPEGAETRKILLSLNPEKNTSQRLQ